MGLRLLLAVWVLKTMQHAGLSVHASGRAGCRTNVAFALPCVAARRSLLPPLPGVCPAPRCGAERKRGAVVKLRASEPARPEEITEPNALGYPEKTVAAVRTELLQRRLQCPFPFAVHAHGDFFQALLQRLQLDGLWPNKYDQRDRNKANKQARLDAAMWAVQHSERLKLSRDQIRSLAKAELVSDAEARRIAADQHNLHLTVVEVLPRTTDSFGVEWTVQTVVYQPAQRPEESSETEPDAAHARPAAEVCLVYSAGKYWATAALVSVSSSLQEDDWMPKSFSGPSAAPLGSRLLSNPSAASSQDPSPAHTRGTTAAGDPGKNRIGDDGGAGPQEAGEQDAGGQSAWPPAPARKFRPLDQLNQQDNMTAIGRSKGAGTTWQLSQAVQRAFDPLLIVEEERKKAEGRLAETRRVRNFTVPGVSDQTLREVEAEWHKEVDALAGKVALYNAGSMTPVDFLRWYRAHWRRQFQVPPAVHNQTLPRVRAMLKREYGIDYVGKALDGYTGVDKFYDKAHAAELELIQDRAVAELCVDSDVYRAVRACMDSSVLGGAYITTPAMYGALERQIDRFLDVHARGAANALWDDKMDMERLLRVKQWLNSPPQTRCILRDLIRPDTPGSVLTSVEYTITAEERREAARRFARLPALPPNTTHVEAAVKLEYSTQQVRLDAAPTTPSWWHTDDVVNEYGVLKRYVDLRYLCSVLLHVHYSMCISL